MSNRESHVAHAGAAAAGRLGARVGTGYRGTGGGACADLHITRMRS